MTLERLGVPSFGRNRAGVGRVQVRVGPEPSEEIPSSVVVAFFALNIFGPSVTTFALLEHFVRSRDRAYGLLAAEQERSETLLLSIFPQAIAERLKDTRQELIMHFSSAVTDECWEMMDRLEAFVAHTYDGLILADEGFFSPELELLWDFDDED